MQSRPGIQPANAFLQCELANAIKSFVPRWCVCCIAGAGKEYSACEMCSRTTAAASLTPTIDFPFAYAYLH